jgi:hypothetical protein
MPTIQQLVRLRRKKRKNITKSPALKLREFIQQLQKNQTQQSEKLLE